MTPGAGARGDETDRGLTDLEAVTLGWIGTHEPATAYGVRLHLKRSPSSRFSGSAGAVYPLVRRLARRGLLVAEPVRTGRREGAAYRLTRAGRRALRAWVRGPLEPQDMFTIDPLRTRMLYLDVLPGPERSAWLDDAEACLKRQLELIEALESDFAGNELVLIANENARRQGRARLAWIRWARARLSGG